MKAGALFLAVTFSVPALAWAQTPSIGQGDVVKVWVEQSGLRGTRGTVEAVLPDSFDVRTVGAPSVTRLKWTSVTRLDVARGKKSKWRGALIWGGLIGLGAAVIAGSVTSNDSDKEATVPLAGWAGFAVGAIIGAHRDTTKWVRVQLPKS